MSFSLINVCIIISPRPMSAPETKTIDGREEGGEDNQYDGYQLVLHTSSSAANTFDALAADIRRGVHCIFNQLSTGIQLMPSMVSIAGVNSCFEALKNFSEESNQNHTFFAGPRFIYTSDAFHVLDLEDAYRIAQKCYNWLMSLRSPRVPSEILLAQPILTNRDQTTMTETFTLPLLEKKKRKLLTLELNRSKEDYKF